MSGSEMTVEGSEPLRTAWHEEAAQGLVAGERTIDIAARLGYGANTITHLRRKSPMAERIVWLKRLSKKVDGGSIMTISDEMLKLDEIIRDCGKSKPLAVVGAVLAKLKLRIWQATGPAGVREATRPLTVQIAQILSMAGTTRIEDQPASPASEERIVTAEVVEVGAD